VPIQTSFSYSTEGWKADRRFKKPLNPTDVFGDYYHANEVTVTKILKAIAIYDRGDFFVMP